MLKKWATLLLVITLGGFRPADLFAESWTEPPDMDFYAHPLIEISEMNKIYATAKIIKKLSEDTHKEIFAVRISSSGDTVTASKFKEDYLLKVEPGTRVLLGYPESSEEPIIVDYDRTAQLKLLVILFVITVLIVGGLKKLYGLCSLALGLLFLVFVYIPLTIKAGSMLLPGAIVAVLLIVLSTIFSLSGVSKKSLAALTGICLSSILILAIGKIFYSLGGITGFTMEPIQLLNYYSKNYAGEQFAFSRNLLVAVLIIGASGVIMDVSVCIASAMEQIVLKNPDISRRRLIGLGINTGRQVVAMMSNTLILAYLGAELVVILSATVYMGSVIQLLNDEWIYITAVQILGGSLGFFAAVPLTAVAAGWLMADKKKSPRAFQPLAR